MEYDSDGVIIGVGLQEDPDETEAFEKVIENIWDQYDLDKNGYLDYDETLNFTKDFMAQLGEGNKGISVKNFDKIFKLIDKDGSGQIDKEEMVLFVAQLKAIQKEGNFKREAESTDYKKVIGYFNGGGS